MKKLLSLLLALTLVASLVVPAIAADGDAAETITTVAQLKDAAAKGGTYKLGADIMLDSMLTVEKPLTIVGLDKGEDKYSISCSTFRDMFRVLADIQLENLALNSMYTNGRVIDNKRSGISITVIDCELHAATGNSCPINVGGNGTNAEGESDRVSIKVSGSRLAAGASGYGIRAFNPVDVVIENSTAVAGYGVLVMKEPNGSIGSRGSVIEVKNSTLTSENIHSGESNAFGAIVLMDENIKVTVDADSKVSVDTSGDQPQYVVLLSSHYNDSITDCVVDIKGTVFIDGKGELLNGFGKANNTILLPNTDAIKAQLETEEIQYVANGDALQAIATITTADQLKVAAANGGTYALGADITLSEILKIEKALTIVGAEKAGGMYSITGNGKNSNNTYKTIEVYADLTLENVEVINNKGAGRPVDMRNDGITLNVINSKLTATSAANNQLITVGGDGKGSDGVADKTVVNVSGSTLEAGVGGYGVIAFNPVEINITNASVTTGYNSLYMKGDVGSLGSAGTVINVKGSTLQTTNSHNGESNTFGLFVTEDKNITLNVDADSELFVAATGTAQQYMILNVGEGSSNVNIVPCTWTLSSVNGNAMLIYDESGLAGDILLPNDKEGATKYQLRKCGYDYMVVNEDQVLVIAGHEHISAPENDIYAHEVKKADAKENTCTEDGHTAYEYCTVCDYASFKIELPATGHTMTKTAAKAATCTEDGNVEYYTCSVCKKTFADEAGKTELAADKLAVKSEGHKMTKTAAKAATCTEDGNVEYYTCSVCKKTFADEKGEKELAADKLVVKSEGHKLTKTAAKAATYTAEGNIEYYTCSVCGKLFADAEGAKAITAADTVIAKLPIVVIEKEEVETDKPETDAPETDAPETEDKEEVTVPEVKVEVKVELQEEAAAEIIEKAVEEAKENDEAPVVVIDVKKEVVEAVQKEDATVKEEEIKVAEVSIPTATVEKVVEADEKATLAVNLTTATVIMDNKALETVAKEAEGKTVELKVDQVAVEELKEEQQAAVENKEVALTISATLICSETKKEIGKEAAGGFGGGTVTVAVPVPAKLPEGVKAADLQVYYVADDGTVTKIDSKLVDGNIVFDLEHFSEYVIAAEKPAAPATGDNTNVALYGVLAIMSVLGMAVVLKKKAF